MRAKKERMECDRFGLLVDTPRLMELEELYDQDIAEGEK